VYKVFQEEQEIVDKGIIQAGILAVRRGGAVLRDNFGKAHRIAYKGKLDLVTDIDHLSEETIVGFLTREFPKFGILAEERTEVAATAPSRWILDPLDGTTNYAHGYPFFCVSLALEQRNRIVWGAVYDPMREELFTAELGSGAYLNEMPVQVSETDRLDRALLCTGFPYDVHDSADNNLNHFSRFIKTAQAIRRDGAAALDLCYVGAGRFDGFWEMKLKPWDMAAGCLVVTEAGGRVTAFDGMPLDMTRGDVLAANKLLHNDMMHILTQSKSHA